MANGKWHANRDDLHYFAFLRLLGGTTVASQATRVREHPEHLASSRNGRLTGSRRLTDASSVDMTRMTAVGRQKGDDRRWWCNNRVR